MTCLAGFRGYLTPIPTPCICWSQYFRAHRFQPDQLRAKMILFAFGNALAQARLLYGVCMWGSTTDTSYAVISSCLTLLKGKEVWRDFSCLTEGLGRPSTHLPSVGDLQCVYLYKMPHHSSPQGFIVIPIFQIILLNPMKANKQPVSITHSKWWRRIGTRWSQLWRLQLYVLSTLP